MAPRRRRSTKGSSRKSIAASGSAPEQTRDIAADDEVEAPMIVGKSPGPIDIAQPDPEDLMIAKDGFEDPFFVEKDDD